MDFNTRTIIDLMELDIELKNDLTSIIDEEQLFSDNLSVFNSDEFIKSVSPLLHDRLKTFIKRELTKHNLAIIKKTIDLNSVDYSTVVNHIAGI